jgi:hypothetical protein
MRPLFRQSSILLPTICLALALVLCNAPNFASAFIPHSATLGSVARHVGTRTSVSAPRMPSVAHNVLFPLSAKGRQPLLSLRMAIPSNSADPGDLFNAERYTEKAFESLQRLSPYAEKFSQQFIESELMLYSLLQDETVQRVLSKAAGKGAFSSMMRQLAQEVEAYVSTKPKVSGATGQKQMANSLRDVLLEAKSIQKQMKDDFTAVEHLLIATARSQRVVASGVLQKYGISPLGIEEAVREVRGGQNVTTRNPEATYEALLRYGRDLTEEAKQGKLDPVIGRDEEIRRTVQILSRRTKNNPVLIGEPVS